MRAIDTRHMGQEKVICCWEVDGVLVDPGPQSTEETLLEALGGERPRALLLTHIHFDHAGATGSLVRRWPDLDVYVHEIGAPHMADPEKLVISGGETLLDGEFRVEYTPGHASHHVCYLHEASRWAFVGDVAGVSVPPDGFTLAPTPPP